jgi:hypothetical protein
MVWLKACKRCGGDLYMEKDDYGSYVACFQCGACVANFDVETEVSSVVEAMETAVSHGRSA